MLIVGCWLFLAEPSDMLGRGGGGIFLIGAKFEGSINFNYITPVRSLFEEQQDEKNFGGIQKDELNIIIPEIQIEDIDINKEHQ